jgi:hypothetical protein
MRKILLGALVVLLAFGVNGVVFASDTVSVSIDVDAINEIAITEANIPLVVDTATAGAQPDTDTDNTGAYSLTTNGAAQKITGVINTAMPDNVTLALVVSPVTGTGTDGGDSANSGNPVSLSTSAADLVTGISHIYGTGTIHYSLTATVLADVIGAPISRTVTLTVVAE